MNENYLYSESSFEDLVNYDEDGEALDGPFRLFDRDRPLDEQSFYKDEF